MSSKAEFNYVAWWGKHLKGLVCEGLTGDEIRQVAEDQAVSLSAAYDAFLRVAGRRCGDLWVGTHAFFPALLGLREAAIELLEEADAGFRLGPTDVVITMHQGYQFLYLSGDDPDPPVFRFVEVDRDPVRVWEHFTELVSWDLKHDR